MSNGSAIYVGRVMHHRLKPKEYKLSHRVYWLLLDLDELSRGQPNTRLLSFNRWNILSFHEADHGDGSNTPLREQVCAKLKSAGLDTAGVSIRILCMPRVLGCGFNPISVYFCTSFSGEAVAVVYEVNNTFHQRHTYVIPADRNEDGSIVQASDKNFYVSPFLDLNMTYAFRTELPGDSVTLSVQGRDEVGPVINTSLRGVRWPLSDRSLITVLLTHPFLTAKVIAAIHWHALRMWIKGFKVKDQPPTPVNSSTIVRKHT